MEDCVDYSAKELIAFLKKMNVDYKLVDTSKPNIKMLVLL